MILPIDASYRLAANRHSWVVQKRRKRKHPKTGVHVDDWESILWFPSLNQAVDGLADLMIRTSDTQTLADALAEVRQVAASLSQALSPTFKVALADPSLGQENVTASLSQADTQEKEAEG